MRSNLRTAAAAVAVSLVLHGSALGSVQVNYVGANPVAGLNATAVFDLPNANTLTIVLTNTSASPFGGVDGDASMVLSSLNFEIDPTNAITFTGGSVVLNGTSAVVSSSGANWANSGYAGNLNDEYGYSNNGVGNASGGSAVLSGITAAQVDSLLKSATTSHSNGGNNVNIFSGGTGLSGGLDFGLVATGSTAFGNSEFILNSVKLTLTMSGVGLPNLDFLSRGSYVEFGSDIAYIGGTIVPPPNPQEPVPEMPASVVWLSLTAICGYGFRGKLFAA